MVGATVTVVYQFFCIPDNNYTGCFIISVTLSLTYIFIKFELKEQYIYIYTT